MRKENKRKNEQGFTFAEIMIVIAIFGILSAVAIPNFLRSLPEKRLKNATRNLYADLQRARLLAVKENQSVTFIFDTAAGTYSYNDGGETKNVVLLNYGAVVYGCGLTDKNTWRSSTETPNDTIPTSGVTDGDGNDKDDITFTKLGEANSEDIYLRSQNDETVCFAVNVSRFGAVKIWRYDSGSGWK